MYKIDKKIVNIDSFKVFNKYLGFKLKENKRILYLNGNIIDKDNRGFFFYENSLCLQNEGKTTFLKLQTNEVSVIPITFNGESGYFENTYISSINSKQEEDFKWTSNYVMYQISPFKKLYVLPHRYYGSGYRFENQYIQIQNERTTLKSLSLLTGEYEWEVSIKAEDNIVSILGVEKEVLVVCVQHPDLSFGLLGIDVQTGAIRWQKDDWQWLKGYHTVLHNGKILSLKGDFAGNTHFIEAEASTATILRSGELPALKQAGISIFNYALQDNYIYFTAHPIGKSEANTIGVLDYNSLKLLWWQEVALENDAFFGASNKPEVAANKLYILDTGGTLHIYERETI